MCIEEQDRRIHHFIILFFYERNILYIVDGLWYKEDWSLNKVTLEHMYLSEFIFYFYVSFYVNFPDSEGSFVAKSMLTGHYRFVVSLTAYKCNWEHFVLLSNLQLM